MSNNKYSDRETRLIVAWIIITYGALEIIRWSIDTLGYTRPQYIIDLALPMVMMAAGAYMLKKKIPAA